MGLQIRNKCLTILLMAAACFAGGTTDTQTVTRGLYALRGRIDTLKLPLITSGYFPYSLSGRMVNSPLFTDGTNVGLGLTAPAYSFEIKVATPTFMIHDANDYSSLRISANATIGPFTKAVHLRIGGTTGGADGLIISNFSDTTKSIIMTQATGYVGIGKTPTTMLDVNGTITGLAGVFSSAVEQDKIVYIHNTYNGTSDGLVVELSDSSATPQYSKIQSWKNNNVEVASINGQGAVTAKAGVFESSDGAGTNIVSVKNTSTNTETAGLVVETSVPSLDNTTIVQEWKNNGTRLATVNADKKLIIYNEGAIDLYSDNITHGVTTILPTNVHGRISNRGIPGDEYAGGIKIIGIGKSTESGPDNGAGVTIQAVRDNGSSNNGAMIFDCSRDSLTVTRALSATDKMAVFQNDEAEKVTIYGDGDIATTGSITSATLTNGYLTRASTGGLCVNSPVFTDGTSLGLGTTSPLSKIHSVVTSADTAWGLDAASGSLLQNIDTTTKNWVSSIFSTVNTGGTYEFACGISAQIMGRTSTKAYGDLVFHTQDTSSISEKMRLSSDGNLRVGSSTNNLNISPTGHLTLNGDATVWDDIRITPGSFDFPGAADPSQVKYQPAGSGITTYLYEFAVGDSASFSVQVPHKYKAGSNIYVHVHWTPGARGNEEGTRTVGWKVDYSWASIDSTFPAMQTADLSDACTSTDHKHLITPEVAITGTGKSKSSMLICNIKRTDTGTDDTWEGTASGELPMLLEVDFHYEIEKLGTDTR